jgi:hypothetical protein
MNLVNQDFLRSLTVFCVIFVLLALVVTIGGSGLKHQMADVANRLFPYFKTLRSTAMTQVVFGMMALGVAKVIMDVLDAESVEDALGGKPA